MVPSSHCRRSPEALLEAAFRRAVSAYIRAPGRGSFARCTKLARWNVRYWPIADRLQSGRFRPEADTSLDLGFCSSPIVPASSRRQTPAFNRSGAYTF